MGCGGPLEEWESGINDWLTEEGILLDGTKFSDITPFQYRGLTCLLFAMTDDVGPTRLIVEVQNPADEAIPASVHEHDYDTDSSQLDAGRATYLLKVVAALVMAVGLLISALSFYILMLSIYLLVEKNTTKLQNLLLIGYTATRVSLPYQILALGMNLAVFLLALTLLYVLRGHYLELLWQMFPQMSEGPVMPAIVVGGTLFILVSVVNIVAVRHKINSVNRPS